MRSSPGGSSSILTISAALPGLTCPEGPALEIPPGCAPLNTFPLWNGLEGFLHAFAHGPSCGFGPLSSSSAQDHLLIQPAYPGGSLWRRPPNQEEACCVCGGDLVSLCSRMSSVTPHLQGCPRFQKAGHPSFPQSTLGELPSPMCSAPI